jgi:membrane-bound serine protease (ClpP class)
MPGNLNIDAEGSASGGAGPAPAGRRRLLRGLSLLCGIASLLLLTLTSVVSADPPAPATSAPTAVPSGRAANNVAVITVEGPIDEWTLRSVKRRMEVAKESGADALCFEVNSPGGEIIACLLISQAIKNSPISNTVAWVNPMAYSGGAVISLSCREIVIADGAVLGDAIPIRLSQLGLLEALPKDEREKFSGPLIADVIDSARRNHYDEMMVQGFVRRGVELWLVENPESHQRLFVTPEQFKVAVGHAPTEEDRLSPDVRSGSGAFDPKDKPDMRANAAASPERKPEATDFTPAGKYSQELINSVNDELSTKNAPRSERPDLAARDQKGKYKVIRYVSDGQGVLTLHERELLDYGVATQKVRTDDELKAFFGAKNVVRLDENWADHTARFLAQLPVKIFLIVVFLVALFVEMTHPGLALPGTIAAVCLVGLVLPPILAGIAGWWTLLAIVAGIGLICVEMFLTPGMAVFGVVGVLLLFAGLVGTFLVGPAMGNVFPGAGRDSGQIGWAFASVFVSVALAGIAIGFLLRYLPQVPVLRRLILTSDTPEDGEGAPSPYAQAFAQDSPIAVGMVGSAITPLRPAGRVQIGDRLVDAVAEGAFLEAGAPVRVTAANAFRVTVEAVPEKPPAA